MSVDFDVVDALAGFAEDLHSEGNFAMRLHDAVKRLKAERDEARAEVERLRGVDCGVTELDGTTTPLCGACLECAFLRGAKAMREAAAQELDRLLTKKKATAIWIAPDEIRALPVPEDE